MRTVLSALFYFKIIFFMGMDLCFIIVFMKKIKFIFATVFCLVNCGIFSQTRSSIQNGAILHAWCWSFKTIEENMDKIAAAGFSAVQTSPANTCLVGDYGRMEIYSEDLNGKWYYHYQPTDWKIGNYQLGTREDFISMNKKAEEYGVGVIVDVLPNHTTPRIKEISKDLIDAVGGIEKLYHKNNDHGIRSYEDRLECTTAQMGGLPDVNTENPDFQAYYMKYVNDLIDCGADGFRYDTAKHIGLPDDPKDPYAKVNNFWPIFLGKESVKGEFMHKNSDELFIYGEVLQGGNSREDAYGKIMPVTASNYGSIVRSALASSKFSAKGLKNWQHPAAPKNIVTWVESHDTYANHGESAHLTNAQLRMGWALIAARSGGTPLFFSRPQGKEATQFPGDSKIGDIGNDEFMNPEVVAVNKFRAAMVGEPEELVNNGKDTSVLGIKRGEKGIVLINSNKKTSKIEIPVSFADGSYIDKANGKKFSVENGILKGKMNKESVCVIY